MPQIFIEKMNQRAAELCESWKGYVEQQKSENVNVDFSSLYETEDRSALKKAIRRLE